MTVQDLRDELSGFEGSLTVKAGQGEVSAVVLFGGDDFVRLSVSSEDDEVFTCRVCDKNKPLAEEAHIAGSLPNTYAGRYVCKPCFRKDPEEARLKMVR